MRDFQVVLLIMVSSLAICFAKDYFDKLDHYIIACHTSDFTCFKRQYLSLRDHVLLGNARLSVPEYEAPCFQYGDSGTGLKMSGLEESELVGIGVDSDSRELTLVLELPLRLSEIENGSKCEAPEKEFTDVETNHTGPLRNFTGNGTIQVIYPYNIMKKKSKTFMLLGEEGLDVVLDIPDLSELRTLSEDDQREYELSEWAYDVVQHINAFVQPYTSKMRPFTERVPLEKYLLLYPDEEYTDIHFQYTETTLFENTTSSE